MGCGSAKGVYISLGLAVCSLIEENCLPINRVIRGMYIVAVIVLTTRAADAWPHKNRQKARIHFLATSTLVRGVWGGTNEDTYLAQLTFTPTDSPLVVCLVDSYPGPGSPLPDGLLLSTEGSIIKVRRDRNCDHPYSKMILRTAPGDPMAILPERLGYQPPLDIPPAPEAILPCYRVIRR
jgi:hypothetical protein